MANIGVPERRVSLPIADWARAAVHKSDSRVGYWTRDQIIKMDRKATLRLAAVHPERMTVEFRARILADKARREAEAEALLRDARELRRRKRLDKIEGQFHRQTVDYPPIDYTPPGQKIMVETAARYGMTARDMMSACRIKRLAMVRHEAMYLVARDTLLSLPQIGRIFKRDHTTVLHGMRLHADRNGLPRVREGAPA